MTPAYITWATKPGNLQRKAAYMREQRAEKIRLGICEQSGCHENALPGVQNCAEHLWRPDTLRDRTHETQRPCELAIVATTSQTK